MKLKSWIPVIFGVVILFSACDTDYPDPNGFVYYDTGSGAVGPNGGEIYIGNAESIIKDANLHINAGILTATTTYSIQQAPLSTSVPGHPGVIIVDFQPNSATFGSDVVIGLSYQHFTSVDLDKIQIFRFIPSSGELIPLSRPNTDESKKMLYGATQNLGYFVILQDVNLIINTGTLTDTRDNQTYKWVEVNGQKWMAENLNFETSSGSYCYDGSSSSCSSYGRLYDQATAASVCPQGWHLPEHSEWKMLEEVLGLTDNEEDIDGWQAQGYVGKKLKSTTGWNTNENGTDEASFNAIPGGFRDGDGTYSTIGISARFWTNTRNGNDYWARFINGDQDGIYWAVRGPSRAYSIRCVAGNNDDIPEVETSTPYDVTGFSVNAGGEITSQGATTVSEKGICWNTTGYPLNTENFISLGSGTSSFSKRITGLSRGTTYYFRAYAVNYDGVGYGEQKTVTTRSLGEESGQFTDTRDNQSYDMVQIGEEWWMAENLNFKLPSGSWCFDDDSDHCKDYGRLYDWLSATSICPPGWKLTSDDDWKQMEILLGMTEDDADDVDWRHDGDIALRLKSSSMWYNSGNGIDDSKLTIKPGGYRDGDGDFDLISKEARFWTASQSGGDPWIRYMQYNDDGVYRKTRGPERAMSVRCIKGENDDLPTVSTITPNDITGFTANVGGNVSSQGGSSVDERGVCWNTENYPSVYDNKVELGDGNGSFDIDLTGLSMETTYYIRAYAINNDGVSYGDVKTFDTDSRSSITGTFTDTRNHKTYDKVKIGGNWWMADNLNFEIADGSWCYDNKTYHCDDYGRLYDWETARTACPSGWELASDTDWKNMEVALGMSLDDADDNGWRSDGNIAESMKSTSGWYGDGEGNNDSEFNVKPGGFRDSDGSFSDVTREAKFWTSTERGDDAWARYFQYDQKGVERAEKGTSRGMSVRCIQK